MTTLERVSKKLAKEGGADKLPMPPLMAFDAAERVASEALEAFEHVEALLAHELPVIQKRSARDKLDRLKATLHRLVGHAQALESQLDGQEPLAREGNPNQELLDASRKAALKKRLALVQNGALLSSGQLQESLGISRQALSKAVLSNRLFCVDIQGENYYPAFYGETTLYDRKKLETVSKLLGDLNGWSKWQFFTTPKRSLDGHSPLQALATGQYETVKQAAAGFVDR